MPTIEIYVPDELNRLLSTQARALLLGRSQYARALLAAAAGRVAQQTEPGQWAEPTQPRLDTRELTAT